MIDLLKVVRSFKYAFAGLKYALVRENNVRFHALASICAVVLSIFFHISTNEWGAIIIAIGMVWAAELFNTAIEKLCDLVWEARHPTIKIVKDVAAAAVLMAAFTALAVGILIFLPKLIR